MPAQRGRPSQGWKTFLRNHGVERTQSAVSEAILNLEAQLGVVLFDRAGRYPRLTKEGVVLLADARSVITGVDTMKARAKGIARREIGAGVSIHPNAARLLKRIGLEDQLQKIGSPISGIALRTSQGEPIATPAGPATPAFSRDDQGYNVHRADFLNLLFDALPEGTVTFGHRCIQLKEESDRVRLSFANGAAAEADVVIGADGIRSVVQREIGLQSRPTSEGIMAYRGLIPAERLPWASDLKDPALWLGSGRSFLLYPVARGRLINMVAFVPTDTDSEESWSAPGDLKALAAEYAGWDQPVQDTIKSLEETFRWGIYDRAPLPWE